MSDIRESVKHIVMTSLTNVTFCAHDVEEHRVRWDVDVWVLENAKEVICVSPHLHRLLAGMEAFTTDIQSKDWTIITDTYV
jgi:hypothetical protein